MKLKSKILEAILVFLLYLFALYFWTLPLQHNPMPFGDVDASSHFTIGDYMLSTGSSVLKTPYHIKFRYGGQNNAFPEYLWYPPQYWTTTGIAQFLGGDRLVPFFLMIAIFCSLIVLTSYFLIRHLFGAWAAFLSSFLLVFSTRDYMIYLWGQWPQSLSFALTPVALYCLYRYTETYRDKIHGESGSNGSSTDFPVIYACMLGLILGAQFFFHPQGMIASIAASFFFLAFLWIREKKPPFSFAHASLSACMLIGLSLLFAPFNVGEFITEMMPSGDGGDQQPLQLQKLLQWYQGIQNDPGLPNFYFTYNQTHGSFEGGFWSWWTLPFLLIGIATLLIRRKNQDLIMLAWLCSFYFLTRLVIFGMGSRDIRMFAYEAHVFYPIIALGILSIPSIFPTLSLKTWSRVGLAGVFLYLAISVNGVSAYKTLSGMENSIGRINPSQYDAAQWIKGALPYESDIYDFGTLGFQHYQAKVKWLGVLSQRHFIVDDGQADTIDYVLVDYTDAIALGNQDYANAIQQFEGQFTNSTALYNKNNIRVYKTNAISTA